MESNLRPLTLGEILDRTAQLYRTNFLLFAGISSVYAGVLLVLGLLQIGLAELLAMLHLTQRMQWVTWTTTGIAMLLMFLIYGAVMASISRAVAWVHLGQPATIRGAYQSMMPRLGSYLWLMTLTFLTVFSPITVLYCVYFGIMAYYVKGFGTDPAAQQAAMSNPQMAIIVIVASLAFFLLLIPVGIYTILMGLRYSLAIPASVVEGAKARQAIRRGIDLAKGSWGRIFLLVLLIGVIKTGLVMITQFFVLVAAFKHPGQMPSPGIQALSQVIGFFTNTFLGPIFAMGVTLFYYDQRVRKEGFDIEWMMQAAGMTPPPASATPVAVEPASTAAEAWPVLEPRTEPPAAADPGPAPPLDAGSAHE
jgi:hypothetical protein